MAAPEYIPGVCNIGRAEIRMRRIFGWIGLGMALALWAAFAFWGVRAPWRLLVFFPASIAAIGYLQAKEHFCAHFGLGGVFNFGQDVGKTDTVEQAEFRRQDRAKAVQILVLSGLAGMAVALAAYLIPL
jgi:hypothetical protein